MTHCFTKNRKLSIKKKGQRMTSACVNIFNGIIRTGNIALVIVIFLFYAADTKADGTWIDCDRTSGYYQYFDPLTINVGKDSVVGSVIGGWTYSRNASAWSCAHYPAYQNDAIQLVVQGYSPYAINTAVRSVQVDGETYTVYNTVVKTGLGYIARWRYSAKGEVTEWQPLTSNPATYQDHSQILTLTYGDGSAYPLGLDVQVRFVKTAATLTSGSVTAFDPMYLRHHQIFSGAQSYGTQSYMIADYQTGQLVISSTGGTCTTPDVDVVLPEVNSTQFTGVGSEAGRQGFNLLFNSCPSGLGSIEYTFSPVTSIIDNLNGVVALDGTSTAAGIGVQLLNGEGIPINFDTSYALTQYDPSAQNANYTVPMLAGLYQTDVSVNSGSVSSAINFTLTYK